MLFRSSRSAKIQIEGASGAGPNLLDQAEEAIARAYGLKSVKLETVAEQPAPKPEPQPERKPEPTPAPAQPAQEEDAFAKAQALRKAALQELKRSAPAAPESKKNIYGKETKREPVAIGELELDMGSVVIEGDVFEVAHKELKKGGAWVVAFAMRDGTGYVRVSKFLHRKNAVEG